MIFDSISEPKNERVVFEFKEIDGIETVYVSNKAFAELTAGRAPNAYNTNDIGCGVLDYLQSKKKISKKENPLIIVPSNEVSAFPNALGINHELKAACAKYLAE